MTDEPQGQPRAKPRGRGWIYVLVGAATAVAVAVGALLAVGGDASGGDRLTVSGSLELVDFDTHYSGCVGQGGYADIKQGSQVVVTDGSGKTVGLGALTSGSPTGTREMCRYYFKVEGVPGDLDYYGIEVAHRGRVQYSKADIAREVRISLG